MSPLAFLKNSPQKKLIYAIAGGDDPLVKETIESAYEQGLGTFLVFGKDPALYQGSDRKMIHYTVAPSDEEAAKLAVQAVAAKQADVLMKGFLPTATLLREVLRKEMNLCTDRLLSHIAVFNIPHYHKPLFITDCAMNIAPDFKTKKQITKNAISVAQRLGIKRPKIAFLSAIEKVTEKMPSTIEAGQLAEFFHGHYPHMPIAGPIAMDAAISKKAARHKKIASEVAGDADILVVPTIESGNILYKTLIYFAQAKAASCITGAKAPIAICSRSDSSKTRLASLLFTNQIIEEKKWT